MLEDMLLMIRNPRLAINTMLTARQKVKFYNHMHEIFFSQPYYWLQQRAKPHTTLIDIGAFIGDTAAYFAMNPNIDRVIAYESHPQTFKMLRENINSMPQGIRSKILIRNKPILGKGSYVHNSENSITGNNRVVLGGDIKATTLGIALSGLKNVMIKSDVEGAEYQIFSHPADLKEVYAVQLEYHKGYAKIQDFFEKAGFKCTHDSKVDLGYLSAFK